MGVRSLWYLLKDRTGLPAMRGECKGSLECQGQPTAENPHEWKARKMKEQQHRGRRVPCILIFNLILHWHSLNVIFILKVPL